MEDDVRSLATAAGSEREPIVGRRALNSSAAKVGATGATQRRRAHPRDAVAQTTHGSGRRVLAFSGTGRTRANRWLLSHHSACLGSPRNYATASRDCKSARIVERSI